MVVIRSSDKSEIDPLDANKSALTHNLTALASAYLATMGCKPIETEVPIQAGWIVDLASFTYPTNTELKQSKLLKVLPETGTPSPVDRDEIFRYKYTFPLTVVVEVKVSIADFKKDLKKKFRVFPAHLCYIAHPKSINEQIDDLLWGDKESRHSLPYLFACTVHWGRIICSDNGERILRIIPSRVMPQHPGDTIDLIANIAIRRDHRTRYRVTRDLLKAYRKRVG